MKSRIIELFKENEMAFCRKFYQFSGVIVKINWKGRLKEWKDWKIEKNW